jgi:hypothetical protein
MSHIPGVTYPGGPVDKKELLNAWMHVYLGLMIIKSRDPQEAEKIEKLKLLLAHANELVTKILDDEKAHT